MERVSVKNYKPLLFQLVMAAVTVDIVSAQLTELHYKNECAEFGQCSQICKTNTSECACIKGFTLDADGKSCVPQERTWKIFYAGTNKRGFVDIDENGNERGHLQFPNPNVNSIVFEYMSFDARNEKIFWTDHEVPGRVYRSSVHTPDVPEVLYNLPLDKPRGIAFDWITGNLYFADHQLHKIFVCRSVPPNYCTTLSGVSNHDTFEIALHPNLGIMFWTDTTSNTPSIFQARMDGTHIKVIIGSPIVKEPLGISVDQGNARIYWIDNIGTSRKISSSNLDGSDIMVIKSIGPYSVGIDVFGDRVFWSTWFSCELQSVNKFNGNEGKVHLTDTSIGTLQGITAYSISNQPIYVNDPCKNNTECMYMCALTSSSNFSIGYSCLCPDGMIPVASPGYGLCMEYMTCNGSACTSFHASHAKEIHISRADQVVIVAGNNLTIASKNFREDSILNFRRIQFFQIREFKGVAYNSLNDTVILTDSKTIFQYDFDVGLQVLVEEGLNTITALAVDNTGGNLYWIDNGLKTVVMMSLRTRVTFTLLENTQNLCGLLIVPEEGSLLLVGRGNSTGVDIYKYTLDGSRLQSVYNLPVQRQRITMAYDGDGHLLWTGTHGSSIEATQILSEGFSETSKTLIGETNPTASGGFGSIVPDSFVRNGDILYWMDSITQDLKSTKISSLKSEKIEITSTRFLFEAELQKRIGTTAKLTPLGRSVHFCDRKQCSHICLASGECKCSSGYVLNEDGRSCDVGTGAGQVINRTSYSQQEKRREQTCTKRICGYLYQTDCEFTQDALDQEAAASFLSNRKPIVTVLKAKQFINETGSLGT